MNRLMTLIVALTAVLCFAITLAGFSVGLYYLFETGTVHWWFAVAVALLGAFDCGIVYIGKLSQ